jgi:DNA invertase Pin-like site-specific DNA recombinase
MTAKVKLYSYARFSSDKQKEGDSIHLQLTLAEEFVASKPQLNLELVNDYQDDGVSAHKGRNVTVGRLGEFLKDVKVGRIEKRSWLGIEDFDRLSRQNYWDAKTVFEEIMNAGITVVTFRDGKVFDLEGLRKNSFDFMMSLMQMVSANEYVARMEHRSKAVWRAKREVAQKTGKIMSSNVPEWIDTINEGEPLPSGKYEKQHFELNEEKSAIVRQLTDLFLNGLGCQTIARKFNIDCVKCLRKGKCWMPGNVRAILNNEALCGRYVHRAKRGEKPDMILETYYPPIVSKATYSEIVLLLSNKSNSKPRAINSLANPLSGLCRCSVCGSLMTRVSQRAYRGRKPYQKLVCIAAKTGKHKYRSIEVDTVIGHLNMLMTFPQAFSFDNDNALIALQTKRSDYEMRIARLTNEMGLMGGSAAIRKALAGIEADLAALDKAIAEEAGKAVYANAKRMTERLVETRAAFKSTSMDAEAVNGLLRRLFKGIKVDIEASELFCTWQDGKVSVLTV